MRSLAIALMLGSCTVANGLERVELVVDGTKRNYYHHTPEHLRGDAPLLILFHGQAEGDKEKGRHPYRVTGFNQLADRDGFIVAYPSAWKGTFAAKRNMVAEPPDSVDDMAFTDAMIEDIASRSAIDRSRVYAVGISQGGFFAARAVCERPGTFAGLATVLGSVSPDIDCDLETRPPWMIVMSVDDPVVPFEGRPKGANRSGMGAQEAVKFWTRGQKCEPPEIKTLPDKDKSDGSTVRSEWYKECEGDFEVRLLAVEGGGHRVPRPGGKDGNRDIDTGPVMWKFLKGHELP